MSKIFYIAAGQQLYLNDLSRARLTPLATYGYGYRPFVGTLGAAPASVEYAYAYGNSPGIYSSAGYAGRPLTVFEPWPYVPGDIWGDMYISPLRQPVAQVQSQTGPNRWESHPVYNPPLASRPVLPPVNSPALDKTPYATERTTSPPPIPARTGPSRPTDVRSAPPVPPSPGPSIDDEPAPPRRRDF
ncbi:MAG: hypothetical protein K8R36_05170 [Planctomycetales bacterium]|nr:hypothetical protein [Planctomycetales bacterium]